MGHRWGGVSQWCGVTSKRCGVAGKRCGAAGKSCGVNSRRSRSPIPPPRSPSQRCGAGSQRCGAVGQSCGPTSHWAVLPPTQPSTLLTTALRKDAKTFESETAPLLPSAFFLLPSHIVLPRNAEVSFHESIENKGPSGNQPCTRTCTHCGLITMLGRFTL